MLKHRFTEVGADKSLLVKHIGQAFIVAQLFRNILMVVHVMKKEFEMSMVGEFTYFLGLQGKQCVEGYFITQENYARNFIKKFELEKCKEA